MTFTGVEPSEGVYRWTQSYNVVPIPYVAEWIRDMMASSLEDQGIINQALAHEGWAGSATVLKKDVKSYLTWYNTVHKFDVIYDIAFIPTGETQTLGPILITISMLLYTIIQLKWFFTALAVAWGISLVVESGTSAVKSLWTPPSYEPSEPGVCAEGYVYDAASNTCIPTYTYIDEYMPLIMAAGALGFLYLVTRSSGPRYVVVGNNKG